MKAWLLIFPLFALFSAVPAQGQEAGPLDPEPLPIEAPSFDSASGDESADDPEQDPEFQPGGSEPEPSAKDGAVSPYDNFEDLLADRDGVVFRHQGRNYLWRDGVIYEKEADGREQPVPAPERLSVSGPDGRRWLSQEADGTIYIEVAPRIWATVGFAHDSDQIEEESQPVLDVFGASLSSPALSDRRLLIAGHTNNLGRSGYNLELSRRRALSVSRYLIEKHGLDPDRLILHGYGDSQPLADNNSPEGLELNRRVEFILLGPAR
jgi:outer membrane protein OmpA-like peptidoglycan-associated protein